MVLFSFHLVITCTGNNAFAVEKEKETHFHEPEVVPLADLEHSPRKRRVSVVARIDKVSQEQQTTNKTRKRDLVLTDGVRSVQMNLWGKQCDMQVTEGARVKIGPVIVDQYKETNNINSTVSTKMQVIEEAEENGTLQGIDTTEKCLLIDGVHIPYRGDITTLGSEDYIISKLPFPIIFKKDNGTVIELRPLEQPPSTRAETTRKPSKMPSRSATNTK
ncbi:uncharacterized protein [Ptychodera flava]|uniref:uncharacterized protein n=1 Tax=Ptychodera flava TaxID=63121 RepID=UPI00396A7890